MLRASFITKINKNNKASLLSAFAKILQQRKIACLIFKQLTDCLAMCYDLQNPTESVEYKSQR